MNGPALWHLRILWLDFDADSMNDVLKSLTINDQGGKVTSLRYDSSIPLEQKLNEFPFRIGDGQPLAGVIDQLKGARVEMEFGPQKVAGGIVSARLIAGDKDHAEREQLTLLMDSGDLRNVDLAAANSIHFTDPALQLQFKDYLAALTSSRSAINVAPVSIRRMRNRTKCPRITSCPCRHGNRATV